MCPLHHSQSLKPGVQLHVHARQRLQARPVLNVSVTEIKNMELEDVHAEIGI